MKEKTRKTALIVLIIIAMVITSITLGVSYLFNTNEWSQEDIDQVAEMYEGIISREEIETRLATGTNTLLKLAIIKFIVQVILLISVIKGPNKNRIALIYLSVLNLLMSVPLFIVSTAILIISALKSKDVPYEKPTPPEVTEVQTFKLPVYIIAFLIVWLIFYSSVLDLFFPQIQEFAENNPAVFQISFFIILLLIVIICLRKEIVRDFKLLISNYGKYHSIIIRGFFWIMLLNIITGLIARKMVGGTPSNNQALLNELPLWFMIIFGSIIGPFIEEGVYRGILGKIINNKVVFVIISTLLFAAMHVVTIASIPENPLEYWFLLQYGVMGLVLSINYTRTKNIFTSTLIHMLMNATSVGFTALVLL